MNLLGLCINRLYKYVCGIGCMFGEQLFACMRYLVYVWGTAVCMYAELGACFGNGCLHECRIACMSAELGACLGNSPWLVCEAPKLAPGPGP